MAITSNGYYYDPLRGWIFGEEPGTSTGGANTITPEQAFGSSTNAAGNQLFTNSLAPNLSLGPENPEQSAGGPPSPFGGGQTQTLAPSSLATTATPESIADYYRSIYSQAPSANPQYNQQFRDSIGLGPNGFQAQSTGGLANNPVNHTAIQSNPNDWAGNFQAYTGQQWSTNGMMPIPGNPGHFVTEGGGTWTQPGSMTPFNQQALIQALKSGAGNQYLQFMQAHNLPIFYGNPQMEKAALQTYGITLPGPTTTTGGGQNLTPGNTTPGSTDPYTMFTAEEMANRSKTASQLAQEETARKIAAAGNGGGPLPPGNTTPGGSTENFIIGPGGQRISQQLMERISALSPQERLIFNQLAGMMSFEDAYTALGPAMQTIPVIDKVTPFGGTLGGFETGGKDPGEQIIKSAKIPPVTTPPVTPVTTTPTGNGQPPVGTSAWDDWIRMMTAQQEAARNAQVYAFHTGQGAVDNAQNQMLNTTPAIAPGSLATTTSTSRPDTGSVWGDNFSADTAGRPDAGFGGSMYTSPKSPNYSPWGGGLNTFGQSPTERASKGMASGTGSGSTYDPNTRSISYGY